MTTYYHFYKVLKALEETGATLMRLGYNPKQYATLPNGSNTDDVTRSDIIQVSLHAAVHMAVNKCDLPNQEYRNIVLNSIRDRNKIPVDSFNNKINGSSKEQVIGLIRNAMVLLDSDIKKAEAADSAAAMAEAALNHTPEKIAA